MTQATTISEPVEPAVPLLAEGQRLARAEFERRYFAMPELKGAQLVEGVVYMPSPVRHEHHGKPHSRLGTYLGIYQIFTPGTDLGAGSSVRMDLGNEPEPDELLFIVGGTAWVDEEDYLNGAPELVAEISASTIKLDLGPKFTAYERNGVKEYVVWRVDAGALDWFVLRNGRFERLASEAGVYKSETFPGLWIDSTALLCGDHARVHEILQQGLNSPEHAAFVAELARRTS
jgi:hypothetical protein